ncbi:MAG: tRNA (guanosine(46)-N7)-methyltransferase TrmB [Pseudomonadota bacterium]
MSANQQQEPRDTRRSESFFGRRKSKALSPKAQHRFDNLLPKLRIVVDGPSPDNLDELFDKKSERLIVEIGFGGGEHLVQQALTNPQHSYIGVEPFVNSMAKALRAIDEKSIRNIRLYDEDAVELLDWLPGQLVDEIDLLYPDPWPKLRHWKRRFVNTKNLDRFARVLKSGGRFHFASDIDTYVNWTLQHCDAHPSFDWKADDASDWQIPYENWVRTRYEAKAVRGGRTPAYLRFEKI